jgi:hypothetical protein
MAENASEVIPVPSELQRPLFFWLIATMVWSAAMGVRANGRKRFERLQLSEIIEGE